MFSFEMPIFVLRVTQPCDENPLFITLVRDGEDPTFEEQYQVVEKIPLDKDARGLLCGLKALSETLGLDHEERIISLLRQVWENGRKYPIT